MSYLTCIETGAGERLDPHTPHSAAPAAALRARYDLERVRREVTRETIARGPASLWRYAPLLPVAHPEQAVSLGEGWTPLLKTPRLGKFERREIFFPAIRIKLSDQSQLHSGQRRIATNIQRRNASCWRSLPDRELP